MKKLTTYAILITVVTAAIISSCNKDTQNCKCTLVSGTSSRKVINYGWGKMTRKDADAKCEAKETAFVDNLYSCELQ